MAEERYGSKFEICLHDISKDDAWMLTYITACMLKDPSCIRDIYQMLTGDNLNNTGEVTDRAIDFILLNSIGNGYHACRILRCEGINTERELIKFVYTHSENQRVFRLGSSAVSDIATYMKIRDIIPKNSNLSDLVSHFMKGANAAEALRLANVKCRKYTGGTQNE